MKPPRGLWIAGVMLLLGTPAEGGTITGTVTTSGGKDARNVVVYLEAIAGAAFAPPTEPAVMDQRNKEFVPRVVPILKGGRVVFHNSDALLHNVHLYRGRQSLANLAMPPGAQPVTKTFETPGEVAVLCNVHPEMAAYILVLETPYWAVTGADGRYEITNVPPGTYTLKTWHETLQPLSRTVSLQAAQTVTVDLACQ